MQYKAIIYTYNYIIFIESTAKIDITLKKLEKMKKFMKVGYIAALIISVGVFNSCTENFMHQNRTPDAETIYSHPRVDTAYGTYLAARVAHLRQDLNTAADYYVKSINLGADNTEIIGRAYVLLTSEGRIDEAAEYAKMAQQKGDKGNFIHFVVMTDEMQKQNYANALESLQKIHDKVYQASILPLFEAWIYAGEGKQKEALNVLKKFKDDKSLVSLYYMHNGMLNDYFGNIEEAQKAFDTVVNNENLELSYRSLQIIGNFYIRNGKQEEAAALVKKYYDKNFQARMLLELYQDIQTSDASATPKLIDSPQKGQAEALFNIGTIFRGYQSDISQIFTALALYLNPQHDVALVSMADLLENNQRYNEAIKEYAKISPQSPIYFMAQLKISSIYMQERQNQKALEKLKNLLELYPNDYQVLFNLGEISRIMNQPEKAIKYYNKALKSAPKVAKQDWTIYYALGMAYERSGQWNKAEEVLQEALKISNRHPFVLNYLGYSWLQHNENSNEALYMIFEAYRQNPEDGHIMDSLGWALYRMGKYEDSIKVLERAAEYLPGNAIVCDHLGDAYWQVGRKDEARFQWQHALILKEDAEELNKDVIRGKISDGLQKPAIINFNESLLVERLKTLNITE